MPRGVYTRKKRTVLSTKRIESVSEAEMQIRALQQQLIEQEIRIAHQNLVILKYRQALAKHGDFTVFEE